MTSRAFRPLQLLVILLILLPQSHSQQPLPQTVEDALHNLSDAAGIVFLGEVIAIRPLPGSNGASGVVEIDFRIDQAIRNCTSNSTYTLREWAGLWAGGDQRYRIGQRLLIFLHTPGFVSTTTASAPLLADLRWVGTHLQRPLPYTSSTIVTAQTSAPSVADTSVAAQQALVSTVLDMLNSWQQPTGQEQAGR
jgi:hypothetical protein